MFDIWRDDAGVIHLKGMLDAGSSDRAEKHLDRINANTVLDFGELDHISSTGLGLLIKAQRRLDPLGHRIRIINCNKQIRGVFSITRFDLIFDLD